MKIVSIVGARPNFMKIAPLHHAFSEHSQIEHIIVHTGQHYDKNLSGVFFRELNIPEPHVNLGIGSYSREEQIEKIAEAFSPVLKELNASLVLVVGDVNSTVACSRVAKEQGVPVCHVEAGLRSFDERMPEEINRIETDQLSDFLFITEPSGMTNLEKEGVPGERFLVGNVMIDTLIKNLEKAKSSTVLSDFNLKSKEYGVSTFHRPSNVDSKESLEKIISILSYAAKKTPVLFPLHPRTKGALEKFELLENLKSVEGLVISEPLGYLDFLKAVQESKFVLTDSGGIQEETTYLRVPCITMRENTERPITTEVGTNKLVGVSKDSVLTAVDEVFSDNGVKGEVPELWDGFASNRITEILLKKLS